MFGSDGSDTTQPASPPPTPYQSVLRMPAPESELLGPWAVPMSCIAPATWNGTRLSTDTW
jgi:hypothetical protein